MGRVDGGRGNISIGMTAKQEKELGRALWSRGFDHYREDGC